LATSGFGALLFVAILGAACGPRDLDREEAKRVLGSSRLFTPGQSFIYKLEAHSGHKGYCTWPPPEPGFVGGMYAREVRSVTGIPAGNGASGMATVEFMWDWKHSPERDKCLGGPFDKPAKAVLQRYDDGWRVMGVQFGDSD
jgi:hypothetical protein